MSITNTSTLNRYVGNGSTDTFSYTFKIFLSSDLVVIKRNTTLLTDTTLVLNTDYTVSGAQVTAGGSIVLTAGVLATGFTLIISRVEPITQLTEFRNQSEYFAELHENAMDKLTMIDQQQQDDINRSLRVPESVDLTSVSTLMPSPAATTLIGWNAAANAPLLYTPSDIVNAGSIGIFTANRALVSNAGGVITAATTTSAEIGFVNGVTSAIQTQINTNSTKITSTQFNTQGSFNIGFTYSAGTFTITAADGTALSATNIGYVTVRKAGSPGQLVTLPVTSNVSFIDDAGASDIVGEEFGTKAGNAWTNARPFYLYAINTDATSAGLYFAISPNPCFAAAPSGTNLLGYKGNPSSTPSDSSMWIIGSSLTLANFTSKPVVRIGGINMTKSSADDWTISNGTGSGITQTPHVGRAFDWEAGEASGTATGVYFTNISAPTWATPTSIVARYNISLDGYVDVMFGTTAAGLCTNGGNGTQTQFVLPIVVTDQFYAGSTCSVSIGICRTGGTTGIFVGDIIPTTPGTIFVYKNDFPTAVANNSFSNTADDLTLNVRYQAFYLV